MISKPSELRKSSGNADSVLDFENNYFSLVARKVINV